MKITQEKELIIDDIISYLKKFKLKLPSGHHWICRAFFSRDNRCSWGESYKDGWDQAFERIIEGIEESREYLLNLKLPKEQIKIHCKCGNESAIDTNFGIDIKGVVDFKCCVCGKVTSIGALPNLKGHN